MALRHAIRGLRQSPALSAVAIASLALGIGANVTIYSVVRELILDDLSATRPDRLARVDADIPFHEYRDLRASGVFQDVAFNTWLGNVNWKTGGHAEEPWQIATSANFFDVLGVRPFAGRLYTDADAGHPVAVVSYGFWRRRLHAAPVGSALELNDQLYTLVGVLPRDYRSIMGHGVSPEIYRLADPDFRHCRPFGRLRDGVSREQTRDAVTAALRMKQPAVLRPMAGLAAHMAAEGDERSYFLFFAALFGMAVLLVVIACSNVAGLLLARGISRRREFAVRKALGATRRRLARSILAEAGVLVACGTAVGLALDSFLRDQLSYVRWPSAYNIPFEFHFHDDRGLFLYGVTAAFVVLLLCALAPVLRGSDADLGLAMKSGEPGFSFRRWNLRSAFVTVQLALSVVLLALGLLFARSYLRIAGEGPGFDVDHTVIAIAAPLPGQRAGAKGRPWRDALVAHLQGVPGVTGVTSVGTLPLMGELGQVPVGPHGEPAYSLGAGEDFCRVLGIRILRGRDFAIGDRERKPVPVVLNETLARREFNAADPVGREIIAGGQKYEVIGVMADAKLRTMSEDHAPVFFTPWFEGQFIVSVSGRPARFLRPLRDAMAAVDSESALDVRPLADAAAGALFPMRVAAAFLGGLGLLALVLVLAGLYASVSYATRRRTREMAIRAAIGATEGAIVWTAIRDGLVVLACGIVAGLPLAGAAIRFVSGTLPDGVDPWSPAVFVSVAAVLLSTGAAAAWIPARRAAAVDPAAALRQD